MLEADVLSVAMEFMDSLSDTVKHHRDDSSIIAGSGAAECRCVSRTWCGVVDKAIARDLPSIPSETLASLLSPGRLRSVLLSCLYVSHDQGNKSFETVVYDSLVSRAEACALQLRAGVEASHPVVISHPAIGNGLDDSSAPTSASSTSKHIRCICCRVALRHLVGQVLTHPAFSWCSTLTTVDSRLLEGCVGQAALLNARWFAGHSRET